VAGDPPITKIVVAADGSAPSWAALRFGADLAAYAQARLVVAHVLLHGPVPRDITEEAGLDPSRQRFSRGGDAIGRTLFYPQPMTEDDLEAIGRTLLDKAEAEARARGAGEVETLLKDGMTSETLLAVLHDERPCLAVLGRHGLGAIKRSGRSRHRLGGVSRRVTEEAACPTAVLSG
jgi:nucleotide-binding universal stress UspA family protein